jgi:FkbM family methyltransferase
VADPKAVDWRQRASDLEAQLRAAEQKLQQARARRGTLLERLHRYERSHLDTSVLSHLLPARAAARRREGSDAAAVERHLRHLERSDTYRAAIEAGGQPSAGADHVELDAIGLWVPQDRRIPGRLADDLLRRGRLPLQEILQTREAIGGGVLLDVGANIGTTSIPRALLGDYALFYACEPEPDNFACLVAAIVRNNLHGIVLPDRCAISDRDGHMRLRRSSSIGGHRLDADAEGGIEVPVFTLESWLARLGVDADSIRFVKVDTQGHESHVLAGAGPLVARPGVVWQLECSPRHLRLAGGDIQNLIRQCQHAFTWFIDLYAMAPGGRVRPISELPEALAYLGDSFTNLLLYRTGPA